MTNLRVEDGAIFEDDRQICNAEIAIEDVYFSQNMRPAAARVVVRMPGMDEGAFVLDLEHLTFSALRRFKGSAVIGRIFSRRIAKKDHL